MADLCGDADHCGRVSTYRKIKISCLKSRATLKGSEGGCEIPRPDFGNVRAVTNVGLVLVLMSCCFLRQARADTIGAGVNRHQNDRITISNQALTSELASAVCVRGHTLRTN